MTRHEFEIIAKLHGKKSERALQYAENMLYTEVAYREVVVRFHCIFEGF